MNRQHTTDSVLEPTIRALQQLSPQSQETIATLVRQLAQRDWAYPAVAILEVISYLDVLCGTAEW